MDNKLIIAPADELKKLIKEVIMKEFQSQSFSEGPGKKEQQVFTTRQAMEYLAVSRSTLQRWRKDGKLPFRRVQCKILYTKEDIDTLLEQAAR